ncbi:Maf family nucleotide pyrophosphatase [Stenotrophomonas sp. 24(2023)]|uniref:Maf family nucleotide pyrophosphatase n=1 Tax=Stenotrophomonas sp. 24(2023) TaxID=3068324 RepID=UPI0027DFAC6D|nr:Maf family nucleotide pyrophosphatase [Stenotrophomonas sp. 24(2023)]WMJ70020.1 Maf family nucleotide pyrophosphatase [Stenotrophomonas sp. 24(2023)]
MLYLASRSPRRTQLLARLGRPFQALDLEVAEVRATGESAAQYVQRVAADKARAGLAQVLASDPQALVIGADTEVVLDGEVFGKPDGAAHACTMLARLAGRTHEVMTAVVVVGAQVRDSVLVVSQVRFAAMDEQAIAAYVATGEPLDKAGAYAIQGGAERWIEHLSGSYSGVMGLPLYQTDQLLARVGVPVTVTDAGREAAHV